MKTVTIVRTRHRGESAYAAFRQEADAHQYVMTWLQSHTPPKGGNVSNELMRRISDRDGEKSIVVFTLEVQ